jgi:hypothetical protein
MDKKVFKVVVLLFLIIAANVFAQADYSKPKEVAQAFLDLCLAGKRFEASKLYCTEGSNSQMEILLMQMVKKDIPLMNDKCKYLIDSCKVDQQNSTAKCFYRKLCYGVTKSNNGVLTLKKIDDDWRVEYLWKRDKFL